MPSADQLSRKFEIVRESTIKHTPRVVQLSGLFDLPIEQKSVERWTIDLDLPEKWNIGVIVGPSGSGKTTLIEEAFKSAVVSEHKWPADRSVIDGFPASMGIKDIVQLLNSVGFSSPPNWLRPFNVLSNGERFRVTIARALAENKELCVVDEFTSVVDRTVAQIGSAAIAKTVRRRNQRFIAVSCHYDILPWLTPDWVFQPHLNKLDLPRGSLQRPKVSLQIKRVHSSCWSLFKKYHYLSGDLNSSSICFVALIDETPVAFIAWLPFVGRLSTCVKARRVHRSVCLPDYQGIGIGSAVLEATAAAWRGLGYRALISTSHPSAVNSCMKSKCWSMTSAPKAHAADSAGNLGAKTRARFCQTRSLTRWTASFEFTGAGADKEQSTRLIYG